jgi:lysophospholipase L1-like esterase
MRHDRAEAIGPAAPGKAALTRRKVMPGRSGRFALLTGPAALLLAGCSPWAPSSAAGAADAAKAARDRIQATTPTPRRDRYYLMRHRQCVARAREGGVDLLFIGDSLTDDWRTAGRSIWRREYGPLRAANSGIRTDQTQFALWRLDDGELDGIEPKAVVVMLGTNNLKSGPTRMAPSAAAAGVAAVVRLVRERLPGAKVLLLGILPRQPKYEWMPAVRRKANALLAALDDGRDVRFLDFSDRYLRPDGGLRAELYASDRLHLSEAGYQVWADAIRGPLRQLMAEASRERLGTPREPPGVAGSGDR